MASVPTVTRVACYARVSTEDQAERQTVDAQKDFLRRYCELHGLTVAGVYVDDGISGATPLEDRPEGRRLLDDAEAGAFTVVLVYRLDRLGRSLKSLLAAHERLDTVGVAIRSGTEPFDTASPIGKFLFSLLGSMAELERSTISERMTGGRDRVARAGQYTGGPIPFGYDLDDDKRFIPSARIVEQLGITEAELVRDIFSRIADDGATLTGETARLSALGIPRVQRYGGKASKKIERDGDWSYATIQAMIHNPMYKGTGIVDAKAGTVERPTEALVDPHTWSRAQVAVTRNRVLSTKNAKHEYLLRGLVKCAHCGRSYSGTVNGTSRQYRCNSNIGPLSVVKGKRCHAATVVADRLEATVWAEVRALIEHPDEYIADAQRELRARLADAGQHEAERRSLSRELAGKEQERERVLDLFRRGRITADECDRDLDKVTAEAREIRALLDGMRARAEMATASEAYLADVGAALAQYRDELDEIERTNDRPKMRRLIEVFAPGIVIETELLGIAKVRERKRARLRLTLAFQSKAEVVAITRSPGNVYSVFPDQDQPLTIERELVLTRR